MNEAVHEANGYDLLIVGGGLAGLAAAVTGTRLGLRVAVLEKAGEPGGRARTQERNGFHFNEGPHALYRGLVGMETLRSFEIEPEGGLPSAAGGAAILGGRRHLLPGGVLSLLKTSLFGAGAKLEFGRLFARLPWMDSTRFEGKSVEAALEQLVRREEVRALLRALFRLATYAHAPGDQCAGHAIGQLQSALADNVLYVDGGWQTIVAALQEKAVAEGVLVLTHTPVANVIFSEGGVQGIRLRSGVEIEAPAVVLAMGPADASSLVEDGQHPEFSRWSRDAVPVRAACLDLALESLPRPDTNFALGIDIPAYFSVHSGSARLAPKGQALIQVARYLAPGQEGGGEHEVELETLCDLVQPGWRDRLVYRRYLPRLTVYHDLVQARRGGLKGRPGSTVDSVAGLYVAGDWVGSQGVLADASLASGAEAARQAAERGNFG